jgi:hypothetical protein
MTPWGSYRGSNINMVENRYNGRRAPHLKAYDSGNTPTSRELNFNELLWVILRVKSPLIIEKAILWTLTTQYEPQGFVQFYLF